MWKSKLVKDLIRILFYWLIIICYTLFIPPAHIFSLAGFYILLSLTLLTTFKPVIVFLPRRILLTGVIIIYLLLRQNHLDNIINTILLVGILITFDFYFRKT